MEVNEKGNRMEENEAVAEPEASAEPAPEKSAIDTLVSEVSDKLEARKAGRDLDYIDDVGDDFDTKPAAPAGEETVESLRASLEEERQLRQRAENRSSARGLREKMKEEFPNANPDTVDKYVRLVASGRKSSESVRAIFDASNRDYARGEDASDLKWKARFEELQNTAKTDAETEVQNAWGKPPPASSALNGKDSITLEEFEIALKDSSMTDAQLEQLKAKVRF